MKVSRKYKEIFRLAKMLKDAKIPFDFYEMAPKAKRFIPEWEHYHINYPSRDDWTISVIEGFGSYGEQDDKLELMGGLTPDELEENDVVGWLTAEEAFERIEKIERSKKMKKKKIMKIDENTLELTEVEIDVPEEEIKTELSEDKTKVIEDFADVLREALGCTTDEFYNKYKTWKTAEEDFKKIYEPFKAKLIELHENQELPSSVVIGGAKLTYVSPSKRNSIDSKKLKEEEPEIAKKFTKTTEVGATVRIEEI